MTPDMASFQTVEEAGYSQEQDDLHPVTLLATSNGTHIAVQVGRDEVKMQKILCHQICWSMLCSSEAH